MANTAANQYYSAINFLVPQSAPQDLDPDIQGALAQIYSSLQQVIFAFVNACGINSQPPNQWQLFDGNPGTILRANLGRLYVTAGETVSFGAMISLYSDGGVLKVRNANATDNTRPADGFCSTNGGIEAGVTGEVIIGPGIATVNGLTIGTRYYLSTSNGQIISTKPTAGGNIEQYTGIALSATQLYCTPGFWIQH
jgi:hypothetical protein